jgi:hypothetical protein
VIAGSDSKKFPGGVPIRNDNLSDQQNLHQLQAAAQELKQVLAEEYTSMFNPMRREYYFDEVTFQDPLTRLEGIDSYQSNVDLLGSRSWLGSLLFENANIVLHSITGGDVSVDPSYAKSSSDSTQNQFRISELTTRWTLSLTFQALPWKPTAVFTGVSVYQVKPNDNINEQVRQPLVKILQQQDYWDSINLIEGGQYRKVDAIYGLQDLLRQLLTIPANANWWWSSNPTNFEQNSNHINYQLLRRAKDYQVRRYPTFDALQLKCNSFNDVDQDEIFKKARAMLSSTGESCLFVMSPFQPRRVYSPYFIFYFPSPRHYL